MHLFPTFRFLFPSSFSSLSIFPPFLSILYPAPFVSFVFFGSPVSLFHPPSLPCTLSVCLTAFPFPVLGFLLPLFVCDMFIFSTLSLIFRLQRYSNSTSCKSSSSSGIDNGESSSSCSCCSSYSSSSLSFSSSSITSSSSLFPPFVLPPAHPRQSGFVEYESTFPLMSIKSSVSVV